MKVGLTGATGVLGRLLRSRLVSRGHDVSPFSGDVRKIEDVDCWLADSSADAVFHLAAIVPVADVARDPLTAFDVNVTGTLNVLRGVLKHAAQAWFFYASTSHIYEPSNLPIRESHAKVPISMYGASKWAAEQACSSIAPAVDLAYCCGRIFSYFHETQREPFLYPTMRRRLLEHDSAEPFELYGANAVRDFLSADDVVTTLCALMDKKVTGTFNLGSGTGTTIADFVRSMSQDEIAIAPAGSDSSYLVANVEALRNALREPHG